MAEDREPHIDAEDARAGSTPGMARPVMIASLVLVIAIFAGLLIYYR